MSLARRRNEYFTRIVQWLIRGIFLALIVCIPVLIYHASIEHEHGSIETEAEINASVVAKLLKQEPDLLSEKNGQLRINAFYLSEHLKKDPGLLSKKDAQRRHFIQTDVAEEDKAQSAVQSLRGADGQVVPGPPQETLLEWPVLRGQAPIYLDGKVVGHFHVERSVSPYLERAAGYAAALFLLLTIADFLLQRFVIPPLSHTEQAVVRKAELDELTGLPNRTSIFAALQDRLAERRGQQMGVLFIDLDMFKAINDSFGHAFGDKVLRKVASQLRNTLRSDDFLGRLAGDEFIALISCDNNAAAVDRICTDLISAFNHPFVCAGHEVALGMTIGVAIAPQHGNTADELIQRADMAMYRAKSNGRGSWEIYDGTMSAQLDREMHLRKSLRLALDCHEFELHYQPIVDIASGAVIGAEALLRWRDPSRSSIVGPDEFIPELESSGMIVPVGEWVLRSACRQRAAWKSAPAEFYVSVNVSSRQMTEPLFVEMVKNILAEEGIMPHQVMLELTESMVLVEERVTSKLVQLKGLGVLLAIDDFGVGFSSLHRLAQLPFDTIKIGRAFIREIHTGEKGYGMIGAMLAMARCLNMQVIGEGIEEPEQRRMLLQAECQSGQGYLFARPMPASAFEENHLPVASPKAANL